jgi:ABC-2 type transport system ATP-binding protein
MSDLALRFSNVRKFYGGTPALDGVSLDVRPGECFGLVGENGAGKTTLIKCMLDLSETDAGVIEIFGSGHRAPGARARLAFLPERFNPPFYLSGRDFLRYLLELHRTAYDEAATARALAGLDLPQGVLDRPARTYSKGMTQKLGLAACLLSRKELLILDEPTSGLDPRARALFKQELRGLRPAGHTVLLTSHALADIEELCDRMAILHQGQIRYAGAPGDLRRKFAARDLEEAFLACVA